MSPFFPPGRSKGARKTDGAPTGNGTKTILLPTRLPSSFFCKLPGCAHRGHKKCKTWSVLPFLIMAGTEKVPVKESLQAAFLLFPPARMTGAGGGASVYPRQGGYMIELLRTSTEDAWDQTSCLPILILGPASGLLTLGSALYAPWDMHGLTFFLLDVNRGCS